VRAAGAGGGGAYNPVYQAMFELLDPMPALALPPPLACAQLELPDLGSAQMDLSLTIDRAGGAVHVKYSTDLFDAPSVARLAECYVQLLEAAAAAPGAPLGALELLPLAQSAELDLFSRGAERVDLLRQPPVVDQFEARAADAPDAPCLLFEGAGMPYGQVADAVGVLAARLRRAGVAKGTVVGVCMDRCFELVVSMLAVLRAGGVYLPLDPAFPPGRVAMYLEDGAPAVVLTTAANRAAAEAVLAALPAGAARPALLDARPAAGEPAPSAAEVAAARVAAAPSDLAVLIFTSGSTGRPKGVEVLHRGMADLVRGSYADMFGAGPQDVYCLSTTINFDPHYGNALAALVIGAQLAIAPPGAEVDTERMVGLLVEAGVTIIELAPSVVAIHLREMIAAAADRDRGISLRVLNLSGEALPLPLAREIQRGIPGLASGVYNT
jgi:non-ribosomal peptide synthetase component F